MLGQGNGYYCQAALSSTPAAAYNLGCRSRLQLTAHRLTLPRNCQASFVGTTSSRQSRKPAISGQKAHAPHKGLRRERMRETADVTGQMLLPAKKLAKGCAKKGSHMKAQVRTFGRSTALWLCTLLMTTLAATGAYAAVDIGATSTPGTSSPDGVVPLVNGNSSFYEYTVS